MRDQALNEARVRALAERVQADLGLGWCSIEHRFTTVFSADRILAEAEVDWEYRQASIAWNLQAVAVIDDAELLATMVHELVHVMIAPLWESLPDKIQAQTSKLMELSTENVSRSILQSWDIEPSYRDRSGLDQRPTSSPS